MNVARPINAFVCTSCRSLRALARSRRSPQDPRPFSIAVRQQKENEQQTRKPAPPSSARDASRFLDPVSRSFDSIRQAPNRTSGLGDRNKFSAILGGMDPTPDHHSLLSPVEQPKPYRFNFMFTKRNTHMTLSAPPQPARPDAAAPQTATHSVLLSLSTGNIGFRKAGRGSFDAAFQLAGFAFKKIQERALLRGDSSVEVVLRGQGQGRDAVTKALLGTEGRLLRPKVCAVIDATRLKIGGSRSPRPRRLG